MTFEHIGSRYGTAMTIAKYYGKHIYLNVDSNLSSTGNMHT